MPKSSDPSTQTDETEIRGVRVLTSGWVDWALKGIVSGLCAGMIVVLTWGMNTESRIDALETVLPRVAKIEEKEDGYHILAQDIAVLKAKLDSQDKQLDRIEKLLEAM